MHSYRALLGFGVSLLLAVGGCSSSPSGSVGDGGTNDGSADGNVSGTVTTGIYAISNPRNRSDACGLLLDDAALVTLQPALTFLGYGASTDTGGVFTWPYRISVLSGTLGASSFSISLAEDWDFVNDAPLMAPPFDCQVRLTRQIDGTIVGNGAATVTITSGLSVLGGTQCSNAAAWMVANIASGFAFPCSSSLTVDMMRIGDIPLPPVTSIATLSGDGAVYTLTTNASPTFGTGSISAVYEDTAVDATGISQCAFDPSGNVHWVAFAGGGYQVNARVSSSAWAPGALAIDGSNVIVTFIRQSDGQSVDATGGTLTLTTAPPAPDMGETCSFSLADVTFP